MVDTGWLYEQMLDGCFLPFFLVFFFFASAEAFYTTATSV